MSQGVTLPRDHVLLSTGAITRFPDRSSAGQLIDQLPRVMNRSLEVMIYSSWKLDEVACAILESGVEAPVVHADKDVGPALSSGTSDDLRTTLALLEANCRFAREVGAKTIVVHLWGLPDSDHRLDNNLAGLVGMADVAAAQGVTLSVESLLCLEGTPLDALRRVAERDDRVRFTLDLEFLALHDQLNEALDADWLWPWVNHIHVKDFDGEMFDSDTGRRRYLHPGEGALDLEGFLRRAITQRGFNDTVTLEVSAITEDGSIDWSRLQKSLEWLDFHLGDKSADGVG